jgi:uncharacterized protein (TIGR02680 family)
MKGSPTSEFSNLKSPLDSAPAVLPEPGRADRWQPLRAGLLNLYRYDYEEFHFAEGRLLLRGNNGSGKSRVLALQLPFLLDGEVSPARVEPDGDAAKRIEWNLLMGRHSDRTGYTWIEFGRRDPDGTLHYLTLGCGLRATSGHTGLHSRWFFITPQRIGRDLFLQNHRQIPLTRDRLAEALGTAGNIYLKAADYRRAVDDALFGLGPRYDALISLLLRLRRPQLTRKLDENELPHALSEALPTLSAGIVELIAEAFRSLQTDKDTVREFNAACSAVAEFLREYRAYMAIAVNRRARVVRSTHSSYETAQRAARDAFAHYEAATAALATLNQQREDLDTRLAAADSAERTLAASPEMRTAEEIRLAAQSADQTASARDTARTDTYSADRAAQIANTQCATVESNTAEFQSRLADILQTGSSRARTADITKAHSSHLPDGTIEITDPLPLLSAEQPLRLVLDQRRQALDVLSTAERKVAAAATQRDLATTALREAEATAASARDAEHEARQSLAESGATLLAAYTTWRASCHHLLPASTDDLIDAFEAWLEQRESPGPVRQAIAAAQAELVQRFATRESLLTQETTSLQAEITRLTDALTELDRGVTVPPPAPPTRRTPRTDRFGAPLWQLCDFRPNIPESNRPGYEAALQASGLLDAWLLPDGRLIDPATEDTFLLGSATAGSQTSTFNAQIPASGSLDHVLLPALDPTVPLDHLPSPDLVARVLRTIGNTRAAGSHWIAADGSWQLGPLAGRWSKPDVDYIGESNRAAARRRQIAALEVERTTATEQLDQLRAAQKTLAHDRAAAQSETAAAPTEEAVQRAGYDLERATSQLSHSQLAAEAATRHTSTTHATWQRVAADLHRDAADLHLEPWLGRLEELRDFTADYTTTLASLWPTLHHGQSLFIQLRLARERLTQTRADFAERQTRLAHATHQAEAARAHHETLRSAHGETVARVLERHAEARQLVTSLTQATKANEQESKAQIGHQSAADQRRTDAELRRSEKDAERNHAITQLHDLAHHHLLAEAHPDLASHQIDEPWSVARAVETARAIDTLLTGTPSTEPAWQERQDALHQHFQSLRDHLIPHGHQPETHAVGDVLSVVCLFQSRPHSMGELHAAFTAEIEDRERLLQAREREIIENHLLSEVSLELQNLIRAAEDWRHDANTELASRPTSTGVRFRFQWEPDPETRFAPIRPILLQRGELWTPAQRAELAAFLQGRIVAEQNDDQTGSWRDNLSRALDYRRWHRFVIERQQDGQWRRLNRITYGTGSGGEKALALTLPRFAAAAAHYRGAAPTAPRLVMLDEAFAGIDPTMRAQCLGVITQFDLDVVMTSELEWGCYATVPALSIYHLATLPGLDAVASTRWLWNGRKKLQIPQSSAPSAPSPIATETETGDADLFDDNTSNSEPADDHENA